MRHETVDNWHRAKSRLESESATVNKDMYQRSIRPLRNRVWYGCKLR